jgi:hypothetical protein
LKQQTIDEPQIEEKYEVTLSSYDQSDVKLFSSEPMTTTFTTGEGYLSIN